MNDDQTLAILRDRLGAARDSLPEVPRTTTASQIFRTTARRRTRRWLAGAVATCAAAGLTLGLVLPAGGQAGPASAPPGRAQPVHVNLAAWSVDTNPNGTVTFRLSNTSHPGRLQRALTAAGVAAVVRWGKICVAQGRHVLLPTQGIITSPDIRPQLSSTIQWIGPGRIMNWKWIITPDRMPAGAHLVISAIPSRRTGRGDIQAMWEFVPTSAPLICARSMPEGP